MKPIPPLRKSDAPGAARFTRKAARFACAAALLGVGLAASLTACIFDGKQASSRGTVVDNELRVGSIYLADGSPAVGARVRVFLPNYVPDSSSQSSGAVFSTRTDSKGKYTVDSLPPDEYNILGELEGYYSYQEAVYLSAKTDSIYADTLNAPGIISGAVRLQPQHDPRTVVVQVLGTNTYVNVDENGRFTLFDLAQGKYSLRLITTLREYTQLSAAINVRKGKHDTLKEPLLLPFTGVPVVQGLTASYDTAKGVVMLKWKPVKYRDSIEYVVYRDLTPVLSPSVIPLAFAQDPIFHDTLAKTPSVFALGSGSISLEYRVKVQNLSQEIGPSYGKARVLVINPDELGTKVRIDTAWSFSDPVRRKDSVIAIAELTGANPITDSLYWYVHDSLGFRVPRGVKLAGGLYLRDTLRLDVTGSQNVFLVASLVDETRRTRNDSVRVFLNSPPVMMASWPDTVIVNFNSAFQLDLLPFDMDGDSISLSAEGLPAWLKLDWRFGYLHGTPAAADTGVYPNIRIIAEDAQHTVIRTLRIRVGYSPWSQPDSLAGDASSPSLAAMGGRLFAFNPPRFGNDGKIQVYDTAVGYWKPLPKVWTFGNRLAIPYAGKILLAGNDDSLAAAIYDTASGALTFLARSSYIVPEQTRCAAVNGKIYCLGPPSAGLATKIIVREYDPVLGKWQAKKDVAFRMPDAAVTGLSGRLYAFAGDSLYVYDPEADAWSFEPPPVIPAISAALCPLGGQVIMASPSIDSSRMATHLQAFNPAAGTWSVLESSPQSQTDLSCAELGGKLYLVGGRIRFRTDQGNVDAFSGMQIFDGRARP